MRIERPAHERAGDDHDRRPRKKQAQPDKRFAKGNNEHERACPDPMQLDEGDQEMNELVHRRGLARAC